MTIIIYKLTPEKAIEIDRWTDGEFEGKFNGTTMTQDQVIDEFNRGYYRTSEV